MTAQAAPAGRLTQSDFARHIGRAKSYVTALKHNGRLVIDGAGHVIVDATLARLAETAQAPERAGVVTATFSEAREQKERYEAARAKREFDRDCGLLTPVDELVAAVADAGTRFRQRLETMADALAPDLAQITDEAAVRRVLGEWAEQTLAELERAFATMAEGEGTDA